MVERSVEKVGKEGGRTGKNGGGVVGGKKLGGVRDFRRIGFTSP